MEWTVTPVESGRIGPGPSATNGFKKLFIADTGLGQATDLTIKATVLGTTFTDALKAKIPTGVTIVPQPGSFDIWTRFTNPPGIGIGKNIRKFILPDDVYYGEIGFQEEDAGFTPDADWFDPAKVPTSHNPPPIPIYFEDVPGQGSWDDKISFHISEAGHIPDWSLVKAATATATYREGYVFAADPTMPKWFVTYEQKLKILDGDGNADVEKKTK